MDKSIQQGGRATPQNNFTLPSGRRRKAITPAHLEKAAKGIPDDAVKGDWIAHVKLHEGGSHSVSMSDLVCALNHAKLPTVKDAKAAIHTALKDGFVRGHGVDREFFIINKEGEL